MSDENAQTGSAPESSNTGSPNAGGELRSSIDRAIDKAGISEKDYESRDRGSAEGSEKRKTAFDKFYKGDARHQAEQKLGKERSATAEKMSAAFTDAKGIKEGFFGARPHIDRVRARFPNMKAAELLGLAVQLEKDFPKDPRGTADRLAQLMYQQLPFRKGKPAEHQNSIRGALDRAFDSVTNEMDDLREPLYQLGPQYAHVWQRIDEITEALEADPMGASARLAAFAGMPVTETQHAEIARAAELQQETTRVASGIDRIIQSGKLPGIEREDVQRMMIDILNDPKFERIDPNSRPAGSDQPIGVDAARTMELLRAYNKCMEVAKSATTEAFKKKAGLSVTTHGTPPAPSRGPAPSRAEAIARALEGMGVR